MMAIPQTTEPKREPTLSLQMDPVMLSLEDFQSLWRAGITRWPSGDAKELLTLYATDSSILWRWRDIIGKSLEAEFPDHDIILWLPDSELYRLTRFMKGEHVYVADYLKSRPIEADGLTLNISNESVIVRPLLLGEALDQTLQKESIVAFAQAAKRNLGFSFDEELKLAAAGDGYLYNPHIRSIRRVAAFVPFVWPHPPTDDRVVWALTRFLKGGLDESRFPIQASAVPVAARLAFYAMRSRAGSTIMVGQELAPKWAGGVTAKWPNGIPGTATITLENFETPVIRQRLNHSPWSSPSEPKSLGFTKIQLVSKEFWPGSRTDRLLRISDGHGAQITFPIIDGFTFDNSKEGVEWASLPLTHRPVILDPESTDIQMAHLATLNTPIEVAFPAAWR